jgi:hypothetical protein
LRNPFAASGNADPIATPAANRPGRTAFLCCLIVVACVVIQGFALVAMNHPLICTCGYVKIWHGVVASAENSQHLTDWYTYSHVIHGFAFYFLMRLVAPRTSFVFRFAAAIALESAWEIVENTPLIMERYRQSALAKGYFGDSAINSIFDTLAAAAGFVLARWLPVWLVVFLVIAMELFALYMIRDNLVLNIIQLISPSERLSRWQIGE